MIAIIAYFKLSLPKSDVLVMQQNSIIAVRSTSTTISAKSTHGISIQKYH
jgi:hypothetical protein